MSENAYTISADYLGGDLDAIDLIGETGRLSFSGDGTIEFSIEWFDGKKSASDALMSGQKGEWRAVISVSPDALFSIGTGDPNQLRTLTRAVVGDAIAGDLGALVGAATSKRNARLLVAYQRDGATHAAAFGVDEGAQVRFIDTVKKWRRDVGRGPLDGELSAADSSPTPGDSELMVEVRDLLREIRDLLSQSTGTRPGR